MRQTGSPSFGVAVWVSEFCSLARYSKERVYREKEIESERDMAIPTVRQAAYNDGILAADAEIVTSGGRRIAAHCIVLASASSVLESMMNRPAQKSGDKRIVPIVGVPCDAVEVFVKFLYSERLVSEEEMRMYGMHLLALSHVYRVGRLKRLCESTLSAMLTAEVVVDVLQLARLCDSPCLNLRCMKLVAKDFVAVERTEAWGFVQANDPWLELDILQFLNDIDVRLKRRRRKREEQQVYLLLSEAMECLQHICTEGCTEVAPHDVDPAKQAQARPCASFRTCHSLQLLIRHFAACNRKPRCQRCKHVWQLLRLHASTCDETDGTCRVPLCRQFKIKAAQRTEGKGEGDEGRWSLLAKRVSSVAVMSSLANRKRNEVFRPRPMGRGWGLH